MSSALRQVSRRYKNTFCITVRRLSLHKHVKFLSFTLRVKSDFRSVSTQCRRNSTSHNTHPNRKLQIRQFTYKRGTNAETTQNPRTCNKPTVCVISCFRNEVDENCALLEYYPASSSNTLPTFRDNLSVPPSNRLSRQVVPKRRQGITTTRCVIGQKGAVLNPTVYILEVHNSYSVRNHLIRCSGTTTDTG